MPICLSCEDRRDTSAIAQSSGLCQGCRADARRYDLVAWVRRVQCPTCGAEPGLHCVLVDTKRSASDGGISAAHSARCYRAYIEVPLAERVARDVRQVRMGNISDAVGLVRGGLGPLSAAVRCNVEYMRLRKELISLGLMHGEE
jgi:hypothetical protein